MHLKNKRVIVTGGAGVIGRELINRLELLGSQVLCLDIKPKPKELSDTVEYTQIDLSEMMPESITGFDPHIIFHLAATFERTEETPEFWNENWKNNTLLSHKVLDAANMCKNLDKFVFASSYLIFSPQLYLFDKPQTTSIKLKETDSVNPRNLCGAAKYYTEKELEFVNTVHYNFATISARIYRVYGLNSRDIISRWVRMALNGEELIVFQKENIFDYIFAGDVAEGLIKMAESVQGNEIINLATGTPRKIEDVIRIINEHIPNTMIKEVNEGTSFEASCADISKLVKLTGWQPTISLENGIEKIVQYEKRT